MNKLKYILTGVLGTTLLLSGIYTFAAPPRSTSATRTFVPFADSTYDIGSTTLKYRTGYFDTIDAANITGTSTITVGADIVSGTADRVLFENAANDLAESDNLTFDDTTLGLTGKSAFTATETDSATSIVANDFTVTHSGGVTASQLNKALNFALTLSGTGDAAFASSDHYGILGIVTDNRTYDDSLIHHDTDTFGGYFNASKSVTGTIGNNNDYTATGIYARGNISAGGTGDTRSEGAVVTASGGDEAYGIYVSASGATTNWSLYNFSSTGEVYLGSDNVKTYWGGAQDSSIYFDGSDLIINSENVTGSDELHITNFDATAIGNLTLANGSITDSSGAISFGDENLNTTGTVTTGPLEVGTIPSPQSANIYGSLTVYSGVTLLDGMVVTGTIISNGVTLNSGSLTLDEDNLKVLFGAAQDASIYFDGSDMVIASENVTASDELLFKNFTRYDFDAPVKLKGYTVATLPAGAQGDTAFVTDATSPTYLGALTGGGAVVCPVFHNGTAWVSH